MKIAFAHWDNRIAPVFDTARQIHVIETESGRVVRETQETLSEDMTVQKVLRLVELGIGILVCGAISRSMQGLVSAYGIQVIPFVAGDLPEVIQAWLCGNLMHDAFVMPGCRRRGRQRFRGVQDIYQETNRMSGKGRKMDTGGEKGKGRGGRRPGRIGGSPAAGTTGYCVCPQCGLREPHERGVPCLDRKCPKCGIAMTRE